MTRIFLSLLLASDAGAAVGGLLALLILGAIYFLPTIIGRGKRNAAAIFWLNLLAGWTVIGWIGALIWAVSKDAQPVTVIQQAAPAASMAASRPEATMATRTAAIASTSPPTPVATMVAATPPPATKPATVNISDELERLFQLKEKGALTEEEYMVHKAKLLA
jgi:hypothetical protein